jgi:hypothetical protein
MVIGRALLVYEFWDLPVISHSGIMRRWVSGRGYHWSGESASDCLTRAHRLRCTRDMVSRGCLNPSVQLREGRSRSRREAIQDPRIGRYSVLDNVRLGYEHQKRHDGRFRSIQSLLNPNALGVSILLGMGEAVVWK